MRSLVVAFILAALGCGDRGPAHHRSNADADVEAQPAARPEPDASQSAGPSAAGRTYTAPADHERVPVQDGSRAVEIDNDTATMNDDRPGERYEIRGN